MAKIVLGLGASHSPLLALDAEHWGQRAEADYKNSQLNMSDGREITYAQLLQECGEPYAELATAAVFLEKAADCQQALDRLSECLLRENPDVVIVVGDDHNELMSPANIPAVSIFYGDEIVMSDAYIQEHQPEWRKLVAPGYRMDALHRFRGAPQLGQAVIEGLIRRHVDIGALTKVENPHVAGFGHAFGFIAHRLLRGRDIPILPVLLNTYYPPNVVTPARAFDIGAAIREAIEESQLGLRVAVVASGGLSHFVVDTELDEKVLQGLYRGKSHHLKEIPPHALKSGSSEILNWILTAGIVSNMDIAWADHIPIYRTPAGTGIGMAFACWREAD